MTIMDMKINHRIRPLGCAFGSTVFSWYTDEEVKESRLTVRTGDEVVYDSGYGVLDSAHTEAVFPLKPRTRYEWTVSCITAGGIETVSKAEPFETGKMEEEWTGKWITCDTGERHPVFLKEISLLGRVKKARLYICGLGLYEAFYNGQKIGEEYLTPYCNDYDNFLQAQTYDVTDTMREDGTLEVQLGNGWYLGRFGFNPFSEFRYGKGYRLIAELHLFYDDGREEVIGSDESWKVRRSNITFSNIYDGEHRDDTLPVLPEEECRLAEGMPSPIDPYSLPLKAHETFTPEVLTTPAGETVFDLKQNIAGIFTLRVHEPKGAVIRLQAGEVLQKGNFYRDNLRTAKAEYVYVSDGNEHVLRPQFTFYGYRYMKAEGLHDVKASDFCGIALYSDFETIGTVYTGNEKINRLIRNSEWGMKGNFVDVPTDCPQRDERMGWTGDAQVFSATAMYFADTYAFYRKYLYDMKLEQEANDGLVPMVIPAFDLVGSSPMGSTASVWGDATTIIPWNMYQFSGDKTILKEHYPAMKAWLEYIRKTDGSDHGWRKAFHFGDWLALDGAEKADAVMGGTETGFIADVYYRKSALIVAETAELLGYAEDAETYRKLAQTIEEELKKEYYSPSGRCAIMTQTGEILSIQNGLGDDAKSAEVLVRLLDNSNGKLKTGFVGTPLLCDTLTKIGRDDLAYGLLLNEEYPGWLYEVKLGATTVWERWNSVGPDGLISSTGMNSLNHYSYGSIVQWIFERCAGFKAAEPGFRKVTIAPLPHIALGSLEMNYRSVSGPWHVGWKLQGTKGIKLVIDVPYGAEAEVELPAWDQKTDMNEICKNVKDGKCVLGGGHYEVTYEMTKTPLGMLSLDSTVGELTKIPELEEFLLAKMPEVGPIPMRTAQGEIFRDFAKMYQISDAVLAEIGQELARYR